MFLGTILNFAGILLGALAGVMTRRDLPARQQVLLKTGIGVALVVFGLKIAGSAMLSSDWRYFGKLFLILLVATIIGRLIGRALRIQKGLNRVGQFAKQKLSTAEPNNGLLATVILLCAAPLGWVGAMEDGLSSKNFQPLLIKGVIDGLGTMAFARMFGWRITLAAVPVAVFQAAIAFGAMQIEPWLQTRGLLDSIHVACGFFVVYVSMIIFEVKKVEVGDYLPSIVVAPALAALFR
jgi:uncharacterized protein